MYRVKFKRHCLGSARATRRNFQQSKLRLARASWLHGQQSVVWMAGWLAGWFAGSLLAFACFNSAPFNDALLRSSLFLPFLSFLSAFVRLCLARLTEPLTALCIVGSCCVETKKCPCKLPSQNNGFPPQPRGASDSRATQKLSCSCSCSSSSSSSFPFW